MPESPKFTKGLPKLKGLLFSEKFQKVKPIILVMILEPELKKFQEEIRSWVEAEIAPQAKELDEIGKFPFDNVKKLAQRGLLGGGGSQEDGGLRENSRHFA